MKLDFDLLCASPRRALRGLLVASAITWTALPAAAQDPAAERLFREAERLKNASEVESSIDEFLLLAQQFPTDSLRPRALLTVAKMRDALGDSFGAQAALDTLLSDHPRTGEAAQAFLLRGELQVQAAQSTDDLAAARATLRRVPLLYGAESFPNLPARSQARVRSAELGLQLADPDTAAAEALAVIEDEAPSPSRGRARLLYATALLRRGEHSAAAEMLERLATGLGDDESPELGTTEKDRARARRLLTLIHRHILRPQAGEPRFSGGARFIINGATLRQPEAVAAAEDGRLLVVDGKDSLVLLLSPEGKVLKRRNLEKPGRPGWAGETPYVVTDKQIVLPIGGQRTTFLEPRSQRDVPLDGMRVATRGLFGHWYVLAKGWKSLLAFENRRVGQELLAKNRPDLRDLAQDFEGRIYVLDKKSNQVGRVGHNRRWQGVVVQGNWRRPEALAVDALGNLYILDRGTRTVTVYNEDGQRLTSLGPVFAGGIELKSPDDLTVDGSGRLFIADSDLPFLVVID